MDSFGGAGRSYGYDAFISYSHAWDGKLAPVLQRELERFATPWYRARSLRVFRDNASLTANPGLWSSIEEALATSQWFVLMASREAAHSLWVDREISWWLTNRSVRQLLIVVTDGELVWNERTGNFDQSINAVLPPSLHGVFTEQPRWVDLRWLGKSEHVDRSNPRLRDCVADVAAAVRGTDKDLLVGEHIRHHRRALRLARGGVTALALLLVVAIGAAMVAVGQRNTAVNNARLATARQLAALAVANLNTHLDLAQLFAVAAYRMDPNPQTRSALFQAVTSSPHLLRYLPAAAQVTAVTGSADGNNVIAGTADGHVLHWNLARNTHDSLKMSAAPITSVATDAHGTRILAADGATAVLWNSATARQAVIHSGQSALVAVAPSGKRLAVLDRMGYSPLPEDGNGLTVFDGDSGQQLNWTSQDHLWSRLGLSDDTTVMLMSATGSWERRSIPTLALAASSTVDLTPANLFKEGYSTNGDYYGYDHLGQVSAWHFATSPSNSMSAKPDLRATTGWGSGQSAAAFAISNDGTLMATAAGATVHVASVANDPQDTAPVLLTGSEGVTPDALAFVGSQRLVAARGDKLVLWDLSSPGRMGRDLGVKLDFGCRACEPQLASSPDGQRVVFVTISDAIEYQLDGPVSPQKLTSRAGPVDTVSEDRLTLPVWSPTGDRLVLLGSGNNRALIWDPNDPAQAIAEWAPTGSPTDPIAARVSANGTRIGVVGSHGDVVVRRFSDGTTERIFPGSTDSSNIGFPSSTTTASINYDVTTAALVNQQRVSLVDLDKGTRRILPSGLSNGVLFTRNELLVLRTNGALDVWDTTGTRLLRSISGTGDYDSVFAAAPQGGMVVLRRSDNVGLLTELDSGVTLGSFPLPVFPNTQTAMVFTPDGTKLLVGAEGGRLTRWDMTETAWVHAACTSAGRDLTGAEWAQNVGTTPPVSLSCLG